MKELIEKVLPSDDKKRKFVIISGLLTLWGIYGIGQYGIALFILTPLFTVMRFESPATFHT